MDERTLRELELAEVAKLYGWAERAVAQVTREALAPVVEEAAPAVLRDVSSLDWEALELAVRDCAQCGLCAKRKQAVFGVGARSGPWMFIGEGPGADEDELGDPFVGQAGKLLDGMLAAAGLKRGRDVYIANVVKCRPPGNRTPTPGEMAACAGYLDRQVELVAPRLIVALGKTAAIRLLGTEASLASLRGRMHAYKGIPVVVTYHPAYLLRTLPEKARAWEDLLFARHALAAAS
ncbi:MAG TPA: uracil-DNA glycosylase [Usitatibacter sp.]|jgi:DNA polymerase|nr:uracil-DNA glycosylase [Usitatibacter sp.]